MKHLSAHLLPGLVALVAVVLLGAWISTGTIGGLVLRVPGLDRPAGDVTGSDIAGPLEGTLVEGDGRPSDVSGAWPRFRGARFDGIADDGVPLSRTWAEGGPERLWTAEMGEGHAGATVLEGRVYVLDYDRETSTDALRCLSLDDGAEIWRFSYPVSVKRNHGMSRTVPAVTERFVVGLGPKCHVFCLDAKTGESYWLRDMVREDGATVPPWYAGQCPLIDQGRAILAPGGKALLMAIDCASGEVLWRSPNPRGWKMTHASIMPMELAGQKMYVYCGSGGVAGVAAEDGKILWDTTDWKISIATVPSPVVLPGGKIFFSGGYNAGALMLQVEKQGDRFTTKTLFRLKAKQFGSTQQTPILYEGHLYGVREKDKQLVCLDLEGKELWASGAANKFGLGPYLVADGLIYVLDDFGLLTMAEATPEAYKPLGQFQAFEDGHDAWGPMALVAGRLILRDLTRMTCRDVSKK